MTYMATGIKMYMYPDDALAGMLADLQRIKFHT